MNLLAIDIGQSGSRVDINGIKRDLLIFHEPGASLEETLKKILQDIPKQDFDVVAISATGLNGKVSADLKLINVAHQFSGTKKMVVIDDGLAGHFDVYGDKDGVTLLIGGGVVCVSSYQNNYLHLEGLGPFFGDLGGGFWLGTRGLSSALATREGRENAQDLLNYLKDELNIFDQLKSKTGPDAFSLALACARKVLEAAEVGITSAVEIRKQGANYLAKTAHQSWMRLDPDPKELEVVTIFGGLSKNQGYLKEIEKNLLEMNQNTQVKTGHFYNLQGAIWAAKNLDKDIPPLLKWFNIKI